LPDTSEPSKRTLQSSGVDFVERGSEPQLVHDPFELDGVEMMLIEHAPEDFDLAILPLLEKKQKVRIEQAEKRALVEGSGIVRDEVTYWPSRSG